jgi:5-methylcytosine-specific restriction endonuclease McrA
VSTSADAHSITRNGISVDPAKHRAWQRRGAEKYAAKRRASRAQNRFTAKIPHGTGSDWPPAVRRKARKRSGGICEVDGHKAAEHLHHRKLRRHGDHRVENALHLCSECHDAVHREYETSYILGWLVRSTDDPAKIPAMIAGPDRVLLTADGRY